MTGVTSHSLKEAPMAYVLGQPVIFTGMLARRSAYKIPPESWKVSFTWKQHCRWWEKVSIPPGEGVIVGRRNLSNGFVDMGGYEEPNAWIPKEYIRAYLVCENIDFKPFHVHPDQLEEWSYERLGALTAQASAD
jgi:hypothetical protein